MRFQKFVQRYVFLPNHNLFGQFNCVYVLVANILLWRLLSWFTSVLCIRSFDIV